MNTLKTIAITAALLILPPVAAAQAETTADTQGVGMYISNIAGSGLTYSRHFNNGWGFHLSGIGWGQSGNAFINAGAAVTRDFTIANEARLYGLVAVGTGLGSFAGAAPANPSRPDLQANFAPGVGLALGPFNVELGYSVFTNQTGPGFCPAGGAGLSWWF
jgi:hypothetical protein